MFKKKEDKVEEEILSIVEEGHEQGILEKDEVRLISNILGFDDKYVRDIMTSRNKIYAINCDTLIGDALTECMEEAYSRYPVYDGDIDNIIGILHFKDLVKAYLEDPSKKVGDIVEDMMYVHPTYDISKLLRKMQFEKLHMAVVIDEYGQTDGIVTLEDIIEEIVGNIQDEHDDEEQQVKMWTKDEIIVDVLMSLNDLKELLPDMGFPENDIETLSGFIFFLHGRFPEKGEKIKAEFGGYEFTPLDVKDNVIKVVRIRRLV